uniref:Uncharacterized protein n=1 Tax=Helianthus annuus TaxID=4232 RepID=A0A251RW00_HELAN
MMLWWFHTTVSPPLLCQLIGFNPNLLQSASRFLSPSISHSSPSISRCLSFINGDWFHPYKLRS